MLAIVSDLHLQQTSLDCVRFRYKNKWMESGIERNVSVKALQRFFSMVHNRIERHKVTKLDIIFAGDIFEIHRNPQWILHDGSIPFPESEQFGEDPTFVPSLYQYVRPYVNDPGLDSEIDNPLCKLVHSIFDEIKDINKDFEEALDAFQHGLMYTYRGTEHHLPGHLKGKIRYIYIPGNHDRLLNAWQSTRRRVLNFFNYGWSPQIPTPPFPGFRSFPFGAAYKGYGLVVRHGHEYDSANFGSDVDMHDWALDPYAPGYMKPSLGDLITIDVAERLSLAFRAYYATELRQSNINGTKMRNLFLALTEFDDVRPRTKLPEYFAASYNGDIAETMKLLTPVLRNVLDEVANHPFLNEKLQEMSSIFGGVFTVLKDLLYQWISSQHGVDMMKTFITLAEVLQRGNQGGPVEMAQFEKGLDDRKVHAVVSGHTHLPRQDPLPFGPGKLSKESPIYFNTGTWRTTIKHHYFKNRNQHSFSRQKDFTTVIAFDETERIVEFDTEPTCLSRPKGRRIDTWTGTLDSSAFEPYVLDHTAVASQRERYVSFKKLHVIKMEDPGRYGEVLLHFGVDGKAFHLTGDNNKGIKVEAGESYPLKKKAKLNINDMGEVWAHATEADWGEFNAINRDDSLGFALYVLKRKGEQFLPGQHRVLILKDVKRKMILLIEFEVV